MSHDPTSGRPAELRSSLAAFRRDPLGALGRARDAGDAAWLRLGRQRLLVVSHPELIEEVFVTRARSFTKEKVLWGGWSTKLVEREGIGTLGSEDWVTHTESRRRIQPAFAPARLDGLRPTVREVALGVVDAWADAGALDVWPAMRRYAISSFCGSMLDTKLDDATADELGGWLDDALAPYSPVLSLGLLTRELPRRRRRSRAAQAIAEAQRWLAELIAAAGGDGLPATLHTDELEPGKAAEDAFTVLLAGVDTSASVLSWLLCLLASEPELCERLAAEWDEAGDGLGPLPLAGRVFQETLRLYPASWFVARVAREASTVAGVELAPGTTAVTSPYVVHRDPRWYERPERFDPDRWLVDSSRPRLAFFPFGGGVRQCPGERLARIEGELLAGAVAARLRLVSPASTPRPVAVASLRLGEPLVLRAGRR